jgi:uncharacterized protein (DUF2132 family)
MPTRRDVVGTPAPAAPEPEPPPRARSRDPLHGVTLEALVTALVARHGWEALGRLVPIRCFQYDPTIRSSLTFLRRTPWARAKVEALFVETCAPAGE